MHIRRVINAVAIVATASGPASTFAWFGATNTLTAIHSESNKSGITVAQANVAIAKNLEHLLSVTVTSTAPDGLAHFNDDTTGATATQKLSTGYVDGGGNFQDLGNSNGLTLYSTLTITVQINWKLLSAAPNTYGWNADYSVYTENSISYTRAEIMEDLAAQTSVKVSIKPSTDSRIRFFNTSAVTGDPSFGDLDAVTAANQKAKGKVDNVDESPTKGYLWFDTISFAGFSDAKQTDNPQASVATTAATKYYVLGKKGNSDNNKDTEAVGGPIDLRLENVA